MRRGSIKRKRAGHRESKKEGRDERIRPKVRAQSEAIRLPASIPQRFYALFWDVKSEQLDVQQHATFILERLLEMGDDAAVRWLWTTYPEETIRHVVRNSRRLSRKTARFWQVVFGLEEEDVRCLSRSYPQEERPIWPY